MAILDRVLYNSQAMPETYVIKHAVDPKSFKIDYTKELNTEQLRVVHNGDGPVLVLAGAGSGKTRTIVYRVAYLLERGVKPSSILLVTFTNKAAKEMLLRIEELLGAYPTGLWGGTFHHVANLLLRRFGQAIDYPPNFTILDQEDAKSLLNVCIKDAGIDTKARRFPAPAVLDNLLGLGTSTREPLAKIIERQKPDFLPLLSEIEAVRKRYTERKRLHHLVDFDDLLDLLDRLLRTKPDIRTKLARQFKYVLVDEYQDTNRLQASIVEQLASEHKNLLVVGDDAQSIYAFRGATVRNILDFPKTFPNCVTYKLETNYRSTDPILQLANVVIRANQEQFKKTLKPIRSGGGKPVLVPAGSTEQEAEFISQRILEFRDDGVPLANMAVLFRATYLSQSLEFELTRRDIPYEYRGGLRFFERAHIKDLLAYVKLADNPRDEVAFLRVLQLYPGIGIETAVNLSRAIFPKIRTVDDLAAVDAGEVLTQRSRTGFAAFQKTYQSVIKASAEPAELVRKLARGEYRDYLRVTYPNADERVDDLLELARFAERYKTLSSFLADVSLQESFGIEGETTGPKDDESMVLSTIHQAKGLEWDVVFVIGCTDSAFPNPRALTEPGGLEEERRLFYVAVTRAKTNLFLSYALGMNLRTTAMRLIRPSQFITDLPEGLLDELQLEDDFINQPDDALFERDELGEPKSLLDSLLDAHARRKSRNKRTN